MAIGSRSQTSRTYLEREFASFKDASLDDLIKHAVKVTKYLCYTAYEYIAYLNKHDE